jgi:hypothetical protein
VSLWQLRWEVVWREGKHWGILKVMVEKGRGVMEWNGKAGSCGLMISKIRGLK